MGQPQRHCPAAVPRRFDRGFRGDFLPPILSAICFDEQQALLQKVPVHTLYLLLLCLVAIAVVLLIQVVGAILVITMLAIPAAIAGTLTHTLSRMMVIATLLGALFTFLGMCFSYELNWPPGATICSSLRFSIPSAYSAKGEITFCNSDSRTCSKHYASES